MKADSKQQVDPWTGLWKQIVLDFDAHWSRHRLLLAFQCNRTVRGPNFVLLVLTLSVIIRVELLRHAVLWDTVDQVFLRFVILRHDTLEADILRVAVSYLTLLLQLTRPFGVEWYVWRQRFAKGRPHVCEGPIPPLDFSDWGKSQKSSPKIGGRVTENRATYLRVTQHSGSAVVALLLPCVGFECTTLRAPWCCCRRLGRTFWWEFPPPFKTRGLLYLHVLATFYVTLTDTAIYRLNISQFVSLMETKPIFMLGRNWLFNYYFDRCQAWNVRTVKLYGG
jgi:hypothetical protein